MDLLNVVSSSWCPYYQKEFEETNNKNLMFVKCQFHETMMTDKNDCRIKIYVCEKCSYTLTIFSMKESRTTNFKGVKNG